MSKIEAYNFSGKKAIVRVDFNVPFNEKFEITDDTRIKAALPTLKKVLADGGSAQDVAPIAKQASSDACLRHVLAGFASFLT